MSSWLSKLAGEYNLKLLGAEYRTGRMFARHDTSEMLWMDQLERARYYQLAIQSRWMSPNL